MNMNNTLIEKWPVTVTGLFENRTGAEETAQDLVYHQGFGQEQISVACVQNPGNLPVVEMEEGRIEGEAIDEGIFHGSLLGAFGGTATGLAYLTLGAGTTALLLGPLAGVVLGMTAGGMMGALGDFGIGENRGQYYDEKIKEGYTLVVIHTDKDHQEQAIKVLHDHGSLDVEAHNFKG